MCGLLLGLAAVVVCIAVKVEASKVAASEMTASQPVPTNTSAPGTRLLSIPPRFMWGWGPGLHGYCGETSFQMHGIYYGNWISSEEVRYASGGVELLVAVNDVQTAEQLKFRYEQWRWDTFPTPQYKTFLNDFVRPHIDQGHPVIFGAYEVLFKGDTDYDHIMPIVGYKNASTDNSASDVDGAKGGVDVEGIYYFDLWLREVRFLSAAVDVRTRQDCKSRNQPDQPYDYCIPKTYDYAIALAGNVDEDSTLVRMQLEMPDWREPDWGAEDDLHEPPVPFTVGAKFFGLTPGAQYNVYRFDDPRSVPTKNFASSSYTKKFSFTAREATQTLSEFDTFMSDGTIFYRCIRA